MNGAINATVTETEIAAKKAHDEYVRVTNENYMMPESNDPAFLEEYVRAKARRDIALEKMMVAITRLNVAKEAHNAAVCDIFMMDTGLKLGRSVLLLVDNNTLYPYILDHINLLEGYEGERFTTWGRLISPKTGEEIPEEERPFRSFTKHIGRTLPFTFFKDVESFLDAVKKGLLKV